MDIHDTFRHLFPCLSVFPALRLSTIRVSSLKLEGLNDCKYFQLQMLHGAKAKNESSVRVLLAGIGRFPPPYACVCTCMETSAFTWVPWCQKSALIDSHGQLRNYIISLLIYNFIDPCHYSPGRIPSWLYKL